MDGLIGSRNRCLLLHLFTAVSHGLEYLRTARQRSRPIPPSGSFQFPSDTEFRAQNHSSLLASFVTVTVPVLLPAAGITASHALLSPLPRACISYCCMLPDLRCKARSRDPNGTCGDVCDQGRLWSTNVTAHRRRELEVTGGPTLPLLSTAM